MTRKNQYFTGLAVGAVASAIVYYFYFLAPSYEPGMEQPKADAEK